MRLLFSALLCFSLATPSAAADPQFRLERAVARLAEAAGGRVGVAAIHLESGRRFAFNADERFPMASTYKVPIALRILDMVDRGELRLDRPVALTLADYRPAWSPLAELAAGSPMTVSVGRLLELMVVDSDNSASDALMRLAGGPPAVTARLRELGVGGIDVNRYEAQFFLDGSGIRATPPESEWTVATLEALAAKVPPDEARAAEARYSSDARDTATPSATADLLARLHRGEALSRASTDLLLALMSRATTGATRIKGLLPAGTPVAHKSGLQSGSTNDVGIVTLPDDRGHLVIAVYVRASDRPVDDRARAIAEIARTLYDFYLLADERPTTPTSPARP
jgi:beta-lactamase class A